MNGKRHKVLNKIYPREFKINHFSDYHMSLEKDGKRLDLYPTRYHDVTNNVRGDINESKGFIDLIEKYFDL